MWFGKMAVLSQTQERTLKKKKKKAIQKYRYCSLDRTTHYLQTKKKFAPFSFQWYCLKTSQVYGVLLRLGEAGSNRQSRPLRLTWRLHISNFRLLSFSLSVFSHFSMCFLYPLKYLPPRGHMGQRLCFANFLRKVALMANLEILQHYNSAIVIWA